MRKFLTFVCLVWFAAAGWAADAGLLVPVMMVPLPGVHGRLDHIAVDVAGQRLFLAALGNDTVEVIDLATGKHVHTISRCSMPQGVAYLPGENRLVIANGGSGVVKIVDGSSFRVLAEVDNFPDADNVHYDFQTGLIYVGYGDGALGVICATNGEVVARIPLPGHPESFQIEGAGNRIYVNVPDARQVVVIDRAQRKVVAAWRLKEFSSNFPMALDEKGHRLFVGCRHPARLVVMDSATGRQVGDVAICGDVDDLFYDARHRRIYASCGEGFVDVISQKNADDYALAGHIATESGARTSLLSSDGGKFYLAVRAGILSGVAEVQVFRVVD